MELTKFEKIMLWVIAIAEKIKEYFLRFYPPCAVCFALVYSYGFIGGFDRNVITANDFRVTITIAIILTITTLLYVIVFLREKLREARFKRWIR